MYIYIYMLSLYAAVGARSGPVLWVCRNKESLSTQRVDELKNPAPVGRVRPAGQSVIISSKDREITLPCSYRSICLFLNHSNLNQKTLASLIRSLSDALSTEHSYFFPFNNRFKLIP